MDDPAKGYWRIVEPVWDLIDIYEGERVFLDTYSQADRFARLLYAAHFAQSEICNGGFRQFFGNSTGILAPESVAGMHEIGMNQVATVISSAMQVFGEDYPRDRSQRRSVLQSMDDRAFSSFDGAFFRLIRSENGGFESAADAFADGLPAK